MGSERGIAGSLRYEAEGIFLVFDRSEAEWFVQMGRHHHARLDVWEVVLEPNAGEDSSDLWLEIHGYSYYTRPILASNVKLVAANL